jgi:ParB family chromosome partitioning protein
MRRRGGLGRGLDALIPSSPQEDREPAVQPADHEPVTAEDVVDSSGPTFEQLLIDRIDPNPRQPRGAFDEEPLQELTASIEAVGKTAGLERIPAIVRTTEDDQLLRDALLENIHREDLNPLEEAAAYEQLLVDFGITQEELAARLGRSRPVIANAMRLLRLPGSVQRRIAARTLSAGHARAVASLEDPVQQERLADRIVAEGLTVRMAEELAQRIKNGEPLLGPDERARVRVRPAMQAPGMVDLAERLSDRLETRVRVQLGKRKGKVLIEFATLDDLQRICDAIGLEQRTVQLPQGVEPSGDDPQVIHEERTATSASA